MSDNMENIRSEWDVSDFGESVENREDLSILLEQAAFQVSVLEDQLKVASGEIKFLRGELSSTQLELISSRSEVQVLLEELSSYKAGKESKEEFPDLLLSSLDKLYADKQQQLWLISSVQNSIEAEQPKPNKYSPSRSVGDDSGEESSKPGDDHDTVPARQEFSHLALVSLQSGSRTESDENEGIEEWENKKPHPSLTLELTKAYDFTPSSWNKRSLNTPSSIFAPKYQSWTPTTPTPCSALRPSLSLHNLTSKTFTEVLIPSIKPPATHQVTPPSSASPKSPLVIRLTPNGEEKKMKKAATEICEQTKDRIKMPKFRCVNGTSSSKSTHKEPKISRKKNTHQTKPQTPKSAKNLSLRPYTSLSSLSEISENLSFLECKKEISV